MKAFRDYLERFNLSNVSVKGYLFTWCNGRTKGFIEERLDRAVASKKWHDILKEVTVETIIWDNSDHYLICISFEDQHNPAARKTLFHKKTFRSETKWCHVDNFDGILKQFWK